MKAIKIFIILLFIILAPPTIKHRLIKLRSIERQIKRRDDLIMNYIKSHPLINEYIRTRLMNEYDTPQDINYDTPDDESDSFNFIYDTPELIYDTPDEEK